MYFRGFFHPMNQKLHKVLIRNFGNKFDSFSLTSIKKSCFDNMELDFYQYIESLGLSPRYKYYGYLFI